MVLDLCYVVEKRGEYAIYQALARDPQVLWPEEPFPALEVRNRHALRTELQARQPRLARPILHLTSDLHEAVSGDDEILLLVMGKIETGWLSE